MTMGLFMYDVPFCDVTDFLLNLWF